MSIISMTTDLAGQINVTPRLIRLTCTDSLATITAAGYVPVSELQTFPLFPTDLIVCNFAGNQTTLLQPITNSSGTLVLQQFQNSDIPFDVTVGQAALASGGSVILVPSYGSQQFKVRTLMLNSNGTNFSGGGGDRLGQITDGTNVYSVIPAANMQALTNAFWGATALPVAASVANNTSTVAGANLVFKYSGGTTDYTAGSLVITGTVQRVS